MSITKKTKPLMAALIASLAFAFYSCSEKTPESAELLYDFHKKYSEAYQNELILDSVALYVDYTTGVAMKSRIKFYWEVMRPILTSKTQSFYSIKGQDIAREGGDVGKLLETVSNYENPNLNAALDRIVESDREAILLTDAELPNPSDPFMKEALTKWLLKGHDVFVIAEPYIENSVKKNLFFFIFYDSKQEGNIGDYIKRVSKIEHFPKITSFNLSTLPFVKGMKGGHSDPNSFVKALVNRIGDTEIQEWSTGWEDKIEKYVIFTKDKKGKDLKESDILIDGLQLNANSMGGLKVTDVEMKVFNINKEYTQFYNDFKEEKPVEYEQLDFEQMNDFILMDKASFERNSVFKLYFDRNNYDRDVLNGSPFNYFKICFYVTGVEETLDNLKDVLVFDDRLKKGYQNVSVYESIKQTIEDKQVNDFIANNPIYTIYVKALDK